MLMTRMAIICQQLLLAVYDSSKSYDNCRVTKKTIYAHQQLKSETPLLHFGGDPKSHLVALMKVGLLLLNQCI